MWTAAGTSKSIQVDRIIIKDILTRCIIGVREDERHDKQDVIINISLSADLRKPGQTDNFEDTIDYSEVKKRVVSMVEGSQFYLLEALAERIAAICLENPMVRQAQVTVEKPGALRFARSVGVEITRDQA
jgi:FolB domain-containing protein